MKLKKSVEDFLESEPKFRERKNKDRGIVNLLLRKYQGLDGLIRAEIITKERVVEWVKDYTSMDRAWRQALEKNPNLRGTDYEDKDDLESKKRISLGYPS